LGLEKGMIKFIEFQVKLGFDDLGQSDPLQNKPALPVRIK